MTNRDDFAKRIIGTLADRAGNRCSNPGCHKSTSGPRTDPTAAINIGVAAHITAAAPDGPRYDPSLTREERSHPDNGIWLCQNCAKLIDNDPVRYPTHLLRQWKAQAEAEALTAIEQNAQPRLTNQCGGNSIGQVTGGIRNSVIRGGDAAIGRSRTENGSLRQVVLSFAYRLPRPHQLPVDIPDFTGRTVEINEMVAYLRQCTEAGGIYGITGMGGVGKTALAIHATRCAADHYPDAHLYVDLQGTHDFPRQPGDVLAAFLSALGYDFNQIPAGSDQVSCTEARAGLYRSALNNKRVLVLLDNALDAAQVRPLLPGSPTCTVVVTSRKLISLPGLRRLNLDKMKPEESREFLLKLAPRLASDLDSVDLVATLCDHLPLALRIAGSSLAVADDWSAREYAQILIDERTRLETLVREDLSVGAALALSYTRVGQEAPDLQAHWRLLGIFPPGGFTVDAVASVWDSDQGPTMMHLRALLERSLVGYEPQTSRYYLHDLLRIFARDLLDSDILSVERLAASSRYVQHYLAAARQLREKEKDAQLYINCIHNERRALLQACDFAVQLEDWGDVVSLHNLLRDMLWHRAYWNDYIVLSRRAAEAARKLGNNEVLMRALADCARGEFETGQFERAEALYLEAIEIGQVIPNQYEMTLILIGMGRLWYLRRQYERGRDCFQRAFEIANSEKFDHRDKKALQSRVHNYLGSAYRKLGDYQRAEREYHAAIDLARKLGDETSLIAPLRNLGRHWLELQRVDEAEALFDECLRICTRWQKADFIAGLKYLLAHVAFYRGDRSHAYALAEESLSIFTRLGMKWQLSGPQSLIDRLKDLSE